jgi:hypothetical protein
MYHAIPSPKKQRAKKKRTKLMATGVFVAVAFLCFGAVKFFTLPALQISDVAVQGTKMIIRDEVVKKAKAEISGNYFYFFPKRNFLLYPKEKMKAGILASFPMAASVALSISDKHELIVSLEERKPVAIWCGREKPAQGIIANSDCFYVDKNGYIFGVSPSFSGDAYFTLYGGETIKEGKNIGQSVATPEIFQKILLLRDFLSGFHIVVNTLFFAENGYAEFSSADGFAIKWNIDQNIDALKGNMSAVFRSPNWKDGIFSDDSEDAKPLQYLDFRFGNKIFYKQKGTEPEISIPAEMNTSTSSEALL